MNSAAIAAENAISQEFVTDIVTKALRAGASDAEAVFAEGDEFETLVRLGQVEQLKEAGSRASGSASVSRSAHRFDLHQRSFRRRASNSWFLEPWRWSSMTSEDPFAGLPEYGEFGMLSGDLDLYYEDVYSLPAVERIEYARRTEAAAMAADVRIQNSGGRQFRCGNRAQDPGQLARVCRGIAPFFLLDQRAADCTIARWRDAARLLVFQPAHRLRCWIRRSLWDWKLRAAPCGSWVRAKFPRSGFRWCLRRRLPPRSWVQSWARSMEMRSTAVPHSWPASWEKRWPEAT